MSKKSLFKKEERVVYFKDLSMPLKIGIVMGNITFYYTMFILFMWLLFMIILFSTGVSII